MTENTAGKFEGLVSTFTSSDEAKKMIKSLLSEEDVKKLGGDADSATEQLIKSLCYFGEKAPRSIDLQSFRDGMDSWGDYLSKERGLTLVETLKEIGALKEDESVKVGQSRRFGVPVRIAVMLGNPDNHFYFDLPEGMEKPKFRFGSVEIPADWKVDDQGKYAQTSKEKALEFFNDKEWEPIVLAQAAIETNINFAPVRAGRHLPIFFVTGGWQSYFWANAKDVIVQEITSPEQIERDFSGDVPEGKFFVKKIKK